MTAYKDLSKEELLSLKSNLEKEFKKVKAKGIKLDMSRGKPSTEQLNLSMGMMDVLSESTQTLCVKKVLTAVTMVFWTESKKPNSFLQI